MTELLENQTQNKALFLLATIKNSGGRIKFNGETGKLEIGSISLAQKLFNEITAHRVGLIRLLCGLDCPTCGARGKTLTWYTLDLKSLNQAQSCAKHGTFNERRLPDFPVLDKNGKEL